MKVIVRYFVGDSHKVKTALWLIGCPRLSFPTPSVSVTETQSEIYQCNGLLIKLGLLRSNPLSAHLLGAKVDLDASNLPSVFQKFVRTFYINLPLN